MVRASVGEGRHCARRCASLAQWSCLGSVVTLCGSPDGLIIGYFTGQRYLIDQNEKRP
jgi:hypothetical protein